MKSFVGASPCHCTCPFSFSDAYGQLKNACTSPKLNVDTTKMMVWKMYLVSNMALFWGICMLSRFLAVCFYTWDMLNL